MTAFTFPGPVAMAVLTLVLIPSASRAAEVTGVWMTDDGEGAVEIERCGDKRCGRLVWLKTPLDETGRPMRDQNNPDPAARQRPVCGVEIIKDAAPQTDGSWDGGSIYDPQEGEVYKVMLKAANKDRLEVRGYIGIKSIGETVVWTRGAPDLKRCQPDGAPKAR
jgi:uncharacterized protein (DUF2147 family)